MTFYTYLPMNMEQSVPKRRHIKFRRRGITQKEIYNNVKLASPYLSVRLNVRIRQQLNGISRNWNWVILPKCVETNPVLIFMFMGPWHRESMSIIIQQVATIYSLLYFCKLLYMFRVVTPPIIRSTYNCNYSIWHWSNRLCYLPTIYSSLYFCKLLYMFRVVTPPIIRST